MPLGFEAGNEQMTLSVRPAVVVGRLQRPSDAILNSATVRSAGGMTMSGYVSGSETCTKISAPATKF
jgi:hypothetical protein